MRHRAELFLGLAGALSLLTPSFAPAQAGGTAPSASPAQEAVRPVVVYEREVFRYPGASRPDPFRSLLLTGDLGLRLEDLTLRGVVYHSDPSRSVAILTQTGSTRRMQLRVGERIGPLRVLSIQPDRVEVVMEELGVSRRETLRIVRPQPGAGQ